VTLIFLLYLSLPRQGQKCGYLLDKVIEDIYSLGEITNHYQMARYNSEREE
jgi:hypothetical protein